MTLQQEDRNALVTVRLQRAKETMEELNIIIRLGLWRTAANRLHFACFYAVRALLAKNGLKADTHAGIISRFGFHFVHKGLINKEQGKLFKLLFELQQSTDYDDWFEIDEQDIQPFLEPAEKFITEIELLTLNS